MKTLKQILWPVILIGVTSFLVPTLVDIFGPRIGFAMQTLQIAGLFVAILSGSFFWLIRMKESRAIKTLSTALIKDDIWDIVALEVNSRAMFYKIQTAVDTKDASVLNNYVTNNFFSWFQSEIKNLSENNTLRYADVSDTRIMCCKDYLDNSKDSFTAYISGNTVGTGQLEERKNTSFSEIYYFKRFQNEWLLDKIDNAFFLNILFLSNKYEE